MRKGIILAGGTGSRLYPMTRATSKQLLPVYNKPLIYYPLSTLMLAGIRELAVITTPDDQEKFKALLGDGQDLGVRITYLEQSAPEGIAQACTIAEAYLNGAPSALILGDNLFYGHNLYGRFSHAAQAGENTIFSYTVATPNAYGVLKFDDEGNATEIVEKPTTAPSKEVVTGLYMLDATAPQRAQELTKSNRGEFEISDLLNGYLKDGALSVEQLGRGSAWLDTGTPQALLEASNFVRSLEERQGLQVGSPEEIAFRNRWIDADALLKIARGYGQSNYGDYLSELAKGA